MNVISKRDYILTYDEVLQFAEAVASAEGWASITDISHTQYKYICKSIGLRFFEDNTVYRLPGKPDAFDYETLYYIYLCYESLCIKYNKVPSMLAFSMFANIEVFTLKAIITTANSQTGGGKPNPTALYLLQKLAETREDSLKDRAIDKGGAVGVAIVGNSEFLWNMPGARLPAVAVGASASLPDFSKPKNAIEGL